MGYVEDARERQESRKTPASGLQWLGTGGGAAVHSEGGPVWEARNPGLPLA